MFGVLSDRLGPRFILIVMRGSYAVLAAILTLLALTGRLAPIWIFVVATLVGLVRPNDQALRNILIGETMPAPRLMGALSFSRATMDSARVAGALAGAGLFTVLGIGPAYILVTALYVASGGLTFGVARRRLVPDLGASPRAAVRGAATAAGVSGLRDLKEGLLHVWRTPALHGPMWLAFLINLTAYPISGGLLPYVARQVYGVDATGLGYLVASFSLGALIGSIAMVATGGPRRPERSMLVYTTLWYAVLLGFGFVRTLDAGLAALFLAGIVQSVAMISMAAWLLAAAGDRFRGRVMGVRMLAVYGLPLGLMASGALIDRIGYAPTIATLAAVGLVFTLLAGITWRASLWHRRVAT
jgi:MFS family permease